MTKLAANDTGRWTKKPKAARPIDTSMPPRAARKARRSDCNGCFSTNHTSLYNPNHS